MDRIDLQNELESLNLVSADEVHFQPPASVKLHYPCIIYHKAGEYVRQANDKRYYKRNRYDVTVISRDPDNTIADSLIEHFKYCQLERRFTVDNLYHDILELFY